MQNKMRLVAPIAAFLAIVLALSGILLYVYGQPTSAGSDSGVAVCQQMASSSTHSDPDEEWREKRLTEFGTSKHEDIRTAGTNFVEAAYRMGEEMEDADLEKLKELNSNLVTTHAVLRNACSNHGVTVPALSS